MNNHEKEVVSARVLGLLFVSVLCGILSAGLWPFHAPKNDVSWLGNENGLYFGHHSTILSSGEFKTSNYKDDDGCSFEIWLQPGPLGISSVLLTLTEAGTRADLLLIYQWTDHLVLQYRDIRSGHHEQPRKLVVGDVFHGGKRVFVAIASGAEGTAVYLDGTLVEKWPTFRISKHGLTGTLALGGKGGWSGRLLGFAIFHSTLTAAQVFRHYESWTRNQSPEISTNEIPIALYLFAERAGNIVRNEIDTSTNLVIPRRYLVLHPALLLPPWKEFRPSWNYWQDLAVNIAGFIPLGFLFCSYGRSIGKFEPGIMKAVILGFMVSLTIEVLQRFLPTRDSGMTDILTNTLGTGLGGLLSKQGLPRLWATSPCKTEVRLEGQQNSPCPLAGINN